MANSGWVRIHAPAGVNVQVGTVSGEVYTAPAQVSVAGGGNIFSAWIKNELGQVDTLFYLVNHSGADVSVDMKWMASDGTPGNNTPVAVPQNQMVQVPASTESGL